MIIKNIFIIQYVKFFRINYKLISFDYLQVMTAITFIKDIFGIIIFYFFKLIKISSLNEFTNNVDYSIMNLVLILD